MTNLLEKYLQELQKVKSSGIATDEISYYPPLSSLINEVGKQLDPQIICIMNIVNQGGGLPDGGLLTKDQVRSQGINNSFNKVKPDRGVIEVKGTQNDIFDTANSTQVNDYWIVYRQVLVTNLREFILVGCDSNNQQKILETFKLAETEDEFWAITKTPKSFSKKITAGSLNI